MMTGEIVLMKPHESSRINKKSIRGDSRDSWPVWKRGITDRKKSIQTDVLLSLYVLLVIGGTILLVNVFLSKKVAFLSLDIVFVLINSEDPDEMSHDAPLYLGLPCLPKYTFRSQWYTQRKINNLFEDFMTIICFHFVQSVVFRTLNR